ncbi:MAG: aldehyde dehydrogenase family protein [Fuerstiella sp.]
MAIPPSADVPLCQLWIAGQSVTSESGMWFDDLNPLDDSLYARAAAGTTADVHRAVVAADTAFQTFRRSRPAEREGWLLKAAELLQQQADEFVEILIDEVGSPITKARREVATATGVLRAAAGATRRLSGKTFPTDVPGRMSLSVRSPLGVVAAMTPFNVPLIKGIKHAAMPLATGNTVVMLPSEETPMMALRIARLLADAGLPEGVFNVVTGSGQVIGDALTTHPLVRMVGFTGSTRVGTHIRELCGRFGKRVTLEMGGKNPLIVLRDADLQKAVQGCVIGSFLYQGQICMASSRIYVEQPVFREFLERFTAAAQRLGMGDLRQADTVLGPIINARQRSRVRAHLENAIAGGATLHTGGSWDGHRCQPTILTDVTDSMTICREETFGPVTSVYSVESAAEALKLANDSDFGLCASVYTSDLHAGLQLAEELQAGMVHVNGTTVQEEAHVPFGGIRDSGFGREGSEVSIDELTEWKWITVQYG